MDEKPEIWLQTDETEEFIGALEHSAELAASLGRDVMCAAQRASGGVHLRSAGNDPAGISMLSNAKDVWRWLDVERREEPASDMPEPKLAPLMRLYERVKKERYLKEPHRLPTNEQTNRDVERLNEHRNRFIHFVPQGLSLEVSGMPRIVRNCCEVIEHLAIKHPTFWHSEPPRVCRRPFGLSHAAIGCSSSMA